MTGDRALPTFGFIEAFARFTPWHMPIDSDDGLAEFIPVYPVGWVSPTRVVVRDISGREYTVRWDTLRAPGHARPGVKG